MSEDEPDRSPAAEDAVPADASEAPASREIVEILRPFLVEGSEREAEQALTTSVRLERRSAKFFSGPLPPAEELASYNDIDPSFADRIIQMGELEQRARHRTDELVVQTQSRLKLRGQPYALAALAVLCLLAFSFMFKGYATQAMSIAIALVVLVTAMFLGPQILRFVSHSRNGLKPDEIEDN